MHKNWLPSHPLWPALSLFLSLSLHQSPHSSLSAFFSHSLSFPPLFLPSGDTPTHWAEPVPLDLCCSHTSCGGSGGRHLAQLTQQSCLFPVISNETPFFRNAKTKSWSFKLNFIRFSFFQFSSSASDVKFNTNLWVQWCAYYYPLV